MSFGQEEEEREEVSQEQKITARDTLPPAEKYGLRVGLDISRLIRSYFNDDYQGIELVGDYRIYRNYYIAAELGNESLTRDEENINVEGSGSYIRAGGEYNTYNNWYGMQNNINAGFRFGFSTFSQTLNNYRIFTGSAIFPNELRTDQRESDGLTASWIEFILGLKVETFKNVYFGASVSLRRMISEDKPEGFDNLFVPGFGRTNDYSQYTVGYNYTISYLIPFVKRKR